MTATGPEAAQTLAQRVSDMAARRTTAQPPNDGVVVSGIHPDDVAKWPEGKR